MKKIDMGVYHRIESVVAAMTSPTCSHSAEDLAANYAYSGALENGYGFDQEHLEVYLDALINAGATFGYAEALVKASALCDESDPYEAACALGAIRKAAMLKDIRQCPAKYVSYGDGDLGKAILKADAIKDIEAMDDASIGEGTWYPCDKDGKELTPSQLAAASLGASRSEAKTRTARENGSKGGRPKKA